MEIALHVYKKDCDVDQFIPAAAAFFQYGFYIAEYAVALRFKIETYELPVLVQLQSRYFICMRVAWADTGKEQQVAGAAGMRIQAHRFRRFFCENLIGHKYAIDVRK